MNPECEFTFSIWADKDLWQEMHPASETSLQHLGKSESLTRNVYHASRMWVYSPVFRLTRTTNKIGLTFRMWVHSPVFEQIRTTDKIGWTHSGCEFAFQCLSRSEPLTRLAEHIQDVSLLSSVLVDQNHWWDWLNMDSGCELLFSVWAVNRWWEWLNMHLECEFSFNTRTTEKNG